MKEIDKKSEFEQKIFISYSHIDRPFAVKLAEALNEKGQDVWFDKWDIAPGDSIVSKIFEEGLSNAKGFIVILSESSTKSDWVKEELNFATLRRIEKITRVIPVLKEDVEVPAALRTLKWIDLRDNFDTGVREIINAIHGITERPPRGQLPSYLADIPRSVGGLSQIATLVGLFLLKENDPDSDVIRSFQGGELKEALELAPKEINDAVDELEEHGLVKTRSYLGTAPYRFGIVEPTYVIFQHFSEFLQYDPNEDLKIVAAALSSLESANGRKLEEYTKLPVGRLNKAVEYMRDYGLADVSLEIGTHPYSFGHVRATRKTRQFVSNY